MFSQNCVVHVNVLTQCAEMQSLEIRDIKGILYVHV